MLDDDLLNWDWLKENRSGRWPRMVCQHLAERAKSSPDEPIVAADGLSWTAEKLAKESSSVAARLLEDGKDVPVVLLVDRSLSSVSGIIGVHWSGRCLVPLDVEDPTTRLLDIVQRVGECTVADATGRGPTRVGSHAVLDVSHVDPVWIDPVARPGDEPALVVFTSGSTGHPKGVIRSGWQTDVATLRRRGELAAGAKTVFFTPLTWFGGITSFTCGLMDGFNILRDPSTSSSSEFVEEFRRGHIDHLVMTPSLAEVMFGSLPSDSIVDSLKKVVFVGEGPRWGAVAAARALGNVKVHVVYGASESLGSIISLDIHPQDSLGTGRFPLGQPEGDHVQLKPIENSDGNIFEIVIHRWVSQGYWKDPEATSERFGTDENGDPFWRSGDLVEVDEDGVLWSIGRSDDVVKISGKLASPAEASAVLSTCPGVRRAMVVSRTLESGRKQLIGHVEADESEDPTSILRELALRLPSHLIPAALVRHDHLPVTDRGKVDRQQLQQSAVVPWRSVEPVEPRTEMEELVLSMSCTVLGLAGLGVDDDLWSFGLDSLSAIELTESLTRGVGSKLDVNAFVGASTPAQIAALLDGDVSGSPSALVDFGFGDEHSPVFMIAGAGSPAVTLRDLAVGLAPRWRAIGIEQRLSAHGDDTDMSIYAATQRSLRALRDVCPTGPYRLVGYSWGGLVVHEMAVQLCRKGENVCVVLLDTSNPARRLKDSWSLRRIVHRPAVFVRRHVGSSKEFWRGFAVAVRLMRRHRPQVFGGPMLVIETEVSRCGHMWTYEPGVQVARVTGKHDHLILPPHVAEISSIIDAFFGSQRVDGSSDS